MNLLDRYLTRELLGTFLFGLAAFTSIISGSSVLIPMMSKAVKYGIPAMDVFQIFMYRIPSVISITLPMAMLLSTILCFSRLSSDGETVAFRAVGISLYRVAAPILLIGLLVSLLNIAFNEWVVPKASYSAEILYESMKQRGPKIQNNVNVTEYAKDGSPLRIINVQAVDQQELKGVTVAEYEQGRLARVMRADSGKWAASGAWIFYDGIMHYFSSDDLSRVWVMEFEKEYIDIKVDLLAVESRDRSVQEMNASELKSRILFKQRTGADYLGDMIQYYVKFSIPFTCFIFTLIGICVGLRPHRSSSAMGLGISLLIILAYYLLFSLSLGLGLNGILPPIFAAWFPNVSVGFAGLFLLQKLATR